MAQSHQSSSCFGQLATLTALERYVGSACLVLEAISRVDETIATLIYIRSVDLCRVANQDKL